MKKSSFMSLLSFMDGLGGTSASPPAPHEAQGAVLGRVGLKPFLIRPARTPAPGQPFGQRRQQQHRRHEKRGAGQPPGGGDPLRRQTGQRAADDLPQCVHLTVGRKDAGPQPLLHLIVHPCLGNRFFQRAHHRSQQSPGHQGPESQERRTVSRYGSHEDGNDHYVAYRRHSRRNLCYQRPGHHQWRLPVGSTGLTTSH